MTSPPPPAGATTFTIEQLRLSPFNVRKHAPDADHARVAVRIDDGVLCVRVIDDGPGGAVTGAGTGLTGLADRVAALGGALELDSPAGCGTRLRATVPLTA